MLCDANGVPLNFLLSGGQASDIAYAQPLLDNAYIPSLRGRPRKRCRWLLADKGYDAEALRRGATATAIGCNRSSRCAR